MQYQLLISGHSKNAIFVGKMDLSSARIILGQDFERFAHSFAKNLICIGLMGGKISI